MAASTPRKKKNVKQLLAESKRPVRTVNICTRADLVDEYETLEARLEKAKNEANSIGGSPAVPEITARLEELREQMDEASIEFRIRGLPQRQFTALVAKYPPREDNKADAYVGYNIDDVVEQLIRHGTEEPVLDDEDWQMLLEETLNNVTWDQLVNAAWNVNRVDVATPFS